MDTRRRVLTSLALLGSLVLAACGGGGGGGGPTEPPPPPPPPPPSEPQVSFVPAGAPPEVGLYLTGDPDDPLRLELRAAGATDLYGVAFDLRFPGSLVSYEGIAEGTFLSAGGRETSIQVAAEGGGTLIVGLSRLGDVPGVDGDGLLLTFRFAAAVAGTGVVEIVDNEAFDSTGEPIPGLAWVAGSIEVEI